MSADIVDALRIQVPAAHRCRARRGILCRFGDLLPKLCLTPAW
jgi:hypothetical protein